MASKVTCSGSWEGKHPRQSTIPECANKLCVVAAESSFSKQSASMHAKKRLLRLCTAQYCNMNTLYTTVGSQLKFHVKGSVS